MRKSTALSFFIHAGVVGLIVAVPLFKTAKPVPVYVVDLLTVSAPAPAPEPVNAPKTGTARQRVPPRSFTTAVPRKTVRRAVKPAANEENLFSQNNYLEQIRKDLSRRGEVVQTEQPKVKTYAYSPPQFRTSWRRPAAVSLPQPGNRVLPRGYFNTLKALIQKHWRIPPGEIFSLAAVVSFRLRRDGTYSGVMLEETSGNDGFDRAALNAVAAVPRFPAFPPSLGGASLDVTIQFNAQGVE